tara:strand:+ start:519 stop:1625 length:1107 start_codon:yes stop_codon:yes gene_type:complete
MAITRIGNPAIADVRGVNFRNIIINGDQSIAQRGTSTASLSSGANYGATDRFKLFGVTFGTWTMSQSTDVPTGQGFAKSLKMDCTTANGSLSADSQAQISQGIEGQNLQYLKKGTSSAESLTWSFWTKSNKTGTYICQIRDIDNSRSISKSYTISSADTWEKKIITFPEDTTGALDNDNGKSFEIRWWLVAGTDFTSGTLATSWASETSANNAVGQVNLADSTSNEWYLTGAQLEAGSQASDFEFLPFDVNKNRCLRYFYPILPANNTDKYFATGYYYSSSQVRMITETPVLMRASPSIEQASGTGGIRFYRDSNYDAMEANFSLQDVNSNNRFIPMLNSTNISGTAGQTGQLYNLDNSNYIYLNAEL